MFQCTFHVEHKTKNNNNNNDNKTTRKQNKTKTHFTYSFKTLVNIIDQKIIVQC